MLINTSLSRLSINRCQRLSSVNIWTVIIGGQQSDANRVPLFEQKRFINKNYDKPKQLLPPRIEYKYKDSKFFDEHKLEDEPYLKLNEEEICDLSKVKLEKDYPDRHWTSVDINEEPFRQILVGNEDEKGFTQTETIADKNRWFWVERLFPKNTVPMAEPTDEEVVTPSGWRPPRKTKPNLPYFIPRTRTQLFPVYRRYQVEGRNNKEYWKNRWDALVNHWHKEIFEPGKFDKIKFENNETTLTLTLIQQIKGDIWQFEEDLRGQLEVKHQKRILSAINEPNGVLTLKGDYVDDCVDWLIKKGF